MNARLRSLYSTQRRVLNTMAKQRLANPVLFVCDIQERFREAIFEFPKLVSTTQKMIKAAQILKIPIIATTQNQRALGATLPELGLSELADPGLLKLHADKTQFSMCTAEVLAALPDARSSSVLIAGIEAHVCVTQTTLDLLRRGHAVYVLADGVSSCNAGEVPVALRRLAAAGATVTTSESALFELLGDAAAPEFRQISGLIKETKGATREAVGALCRI